MTSVRRVAGRRVAGSPSAGSPGAPHLAGAGFMTSLVQSDWARGLVPRKVGCRRGYRRAVPLWLQEGGAAVCTGARRLTPPTSGGRAR